MLPTKVTPARNRSSQISKTTFLGSLKFQDSINEQSTRCRPGLEDCDPVTAADKLFRTSQPCRPAANDSDFFSCEFSNRNAHPLHAPLVVCCKSLQRTRRNSQMSLLSSPHTRLHTASPVDRCARRLPAVNWSSDKPRRPPGTVPSRSARPHRIYRWRLGRPSGRVLDRGSGYSVWPHRRPILRSRRMTTSSKSRMRSSAWRSGSPRDSKSHALPPVNRRKITRNQFISFCHGITPFGSCCQGFTQAGRKYISPTSLNF